MAEINMESGDSRKSFIDSVLRLSENIRNSPDDFENTLTSDFLDALAAWVCDMDGYYANVGTSIPKPDWSFIETVLKAAAVYE